MTDALPAFVGGTMIFTIPVTNTGTVPAENVVLTDVLPASVTFLSSNVPCTLGPGTLLTCNLGTIGPGATARVIIQVRPNTPGSVTNEVTVVGTNTDVAAAATTTLVILAADLAVTKAAAGTGQVNVGLTFTETVTNLGPSTATGVTLTDTLPANVRIISVSPSQGTCTITGRSVVCLLGTLAPGETATVRGNEFDPNRANNTATATVVVTQCATGIF